MAVNIKLSERLVEKAKAHALANHRSIPKQIEYWSQLGRIVEENPDLPYSLVRDILLADQEEIVGEYHFG